MVLRRALEGFGWVKKETPQEIQRRALREFDTNLSSKGFEYTRNQLLSPTEFPYNQEDVYFTDYSAGFLAQFEGGPQLILQKIDRFKELGDYTAFSILHSYNYRSNVAEGMEFLDTNKELFKGRLGQQTLEFLFNLPNQSDYIPDGEDDDDEDIQIMYVGRPIHESPETAEVDIDDDEDGQDIGSWDLIEKLFNGGYFNYLWLDNNECRDILSKVGLSLEPQSGQTIH